jgi:hypothetical protein
VLHGAQTRISVVAPFYTPVPVIPPVSFMMVVAEPGQAGGMVAGGGPGYTPARTGGTHGSTTIQQQRGSLVEVPNQNDETVMTLKPMNLHWCRPAG